MDKILDNPLDCTACMACYRSCNYNALEQRKDNLGFIYPEIIVSECITCHKCQDKCPIYKDNLKPLLNSGNPRLYLGKHKNVDVLKQSTSGGLFTVLSDAILEQGGTVYGVVFDEELKVVHTRAETNEQRDKMRFSKYVQTDIKDMYSLIMKDLIKGKKVLFTGNPCQCAGIKTIFNKTRYYNNLYIIDIMCFGIPSPKLYEDYKSLLEQENNGQLKSIQFRSKKYPWLRVNSNKGMLYEINGIEKEDNRYYDVFTNFPLLIRECCYNCQFTSTQRVGDITLADYWGIETIDKSLYDSNGVSAILINNEKGQALFDYNQSDLSYEIRDMSEILANQERLHKPATRPSNKDELVNLYLESDLDTLFKHLKND